MNNPRYDVYESLAHEHNSRILKVSDDARKLRSLSRKAEAEPKAPAPKTSRPRLGNLLASLLVILKRQPA